ncbi:MAG: hypothetical protein V3V26_00600 [Candidatus Aenigmarchaeota archaeon]
MYLLIGVLGAVFILLSWVFETIEGVKEHKSLLDIRFAAIYLPGVALLVAYSWYIADPVFLWLNTAIAIFVAFELWYSIHIKKVHRKPLAGTIKVSPKQRKRKK